MVRPTATTSTSACSHGRPACTICAGDRIAGNTCQRAAKVHCAGGAEPGWAGACMGPIAAASSRARDSREAGETCAASAAGASGCSKLKGHNDLLQCSKKKWEDT